MSAKGEFSGAFLLMHLLRLVEQDGKWWEMEYLHEKFRHYHHHHHRVDEMTYLDDEKMKKIRNDVPCHDHFEVVEFVLGKEDA
ncbi:hypothetical protein Tco_1118187 [Tanacetum coccineum]